MAAKTPGETSSLRSSSKIEPSPATITHSEELGEDKLPPTDQGVAAWMQCVGGFCIYFSTWGMIGSYGVFQSYYESNLLSSESPSSISWIGSLQGALTFFGSALVGPLHDRGHFKWLLRAGSLLTVLGMMLTSVSTRYWHFILTQGIVTGAGLALLWVPSVAVVSSWFIRRRALALTFASMGTGVSGMVLPILFNQTVPKVGFGWAVRIISFLLLALLLLANYSISERTKSLRRRKLFDTSAWKEGPYVLLAVFSLLSYVGVYIPFFYIQVYAVTVAHVPSNITVYLVPLVNAGYLTGRIIPGFLADYIGVNNTLIPFLAVSGVTAICWIAVHNEAGLIAFAVLFGFVSSPLGSLGPATVISITSDFSRLGVRIGMMCIPLGLGFLIGTPISGAILQNSGWLGLQIFCGCAIFGSALALLASRLLKTGWVLKVKH